MSLKFKSNTQRIGKENKYIQKKGLRNTRVISREEKKIREEKT